MNLKIANISIASNGYEHLENIKSDDKIIYSEYILFVGSFTDHKNFNLLVELYNKNPEKYPKLIMAGGFNKKVFNNTEINSNNIIFVQNFTDEVLVNLYKNCLAVVFPSKFEGFGIPLLECIYFNKPIICSDIPVFREIGNDYPNYFDLENIEELKYFLKKIKNGSQLRKGNNEKILKKYSWKNSLTIINNKI